MQTTSQEVDAGIQRLEELAPANWRMVLLDGRERLSFTNGLSTPLAIIFGEHEEGLYEVNLWDENHRPSDYGVEADSRLSRDDYRMKIKALIGEWFFRMDQWEEEYSKFFASMESGMQR